MSVDFTKDSYVIYHKPDDYPDRYAVRRWVSTPFHPQPVADPQWLKLAWTLEEARAFIPPGFVNCGRKTIDAGSIVEAWLERPSVELARTLGGPRRGHH